MSANIERLALTAVAGNDGDIGLDTLRRLQGELHVLYMALTNTDDGVVSTHIVADVVAQMGHRIDLALALADDRIVEQHREASK